MTVKVIFDSNFLFVPSEFRVDIFETLLALINERVDPVLLSTNFDELKRMATNAAPKLRKRAMFALKLAEKCRMVNVRKSEGETNDDLIVRVAELWNCPVATNDRELRRRLRSRNIPVIFLRGKNRVDFEGALLGSRASSPKG